MPSPTEIAAFTKELKKLWLTMPELRFGQLVVNAVRTGTRSDLSYPEIFYLDDAEAMDGLKRLAKGIEKYPRKDPSYAPKAFSTSMQPGRPPALISG